MNNSKNSNKNINRRDFLKFGFAPFFISTFNKNNNGYQAIIAPKNFYLDKINVNLNGYKIALNENSTFQLLLDCKTEIPYDHCNYHNYNDIIILDYINSRKLFFESIYFEWSNIQNNKLFEYGYNYGDKLKITSGVSV